MKSAQWSRMRFCPTVATIKRYLPGKGPAEFTFLLRTPASVFT
jgi:hypothetical protein